MTAVLDRDGLASGFRSSSPDLADNRTPLDLLGVVFPKTVRTPALELVNDAVVWAEATPDARLIVTMPPQESKSSTVTRAGGLYLLRRDPTRRIIIASYADRLARRWGRQIRNDVLTNSGARHGGARRAGGGWPAWGEGAAGEGRRGASCGRC